jgi:hypothetical protein
MQHRSRGTVRAALLTTVGLLAAVLIWRIRPGTPSVLATPDGDVVLGCAWSAWVLAGYLAMAVTATALAHLLAAAGVAADALAHLAPASLRRVINAALTVSVAAAVLGTSVTLPAVAATNHTLTSGASRPAAAAGALDWPGLTDPAVPAVPIVHRTYRPERPPQAASPAPHSSPSRPRFPGRGNHGVVVQRGDTLWSIAARHLGRAASRADIAASWHEWYAANRHVVGDDPNLIIPGQRLSPPASTPPQGSSQ